MAKVKFPDARVQTTVRLDPKLFEDFQIACIHRKISQTEAIDQALRAWLKASRVKD